MRHCEHVNNWSNPWGAQVVRTEETCWRLNCHFFLLAFLLKQIRKIHSIPCEFTMQLCRCQKQLGSHGVPFRWLSIAPVLPLVYLIPACKVCISFLFRFSKYCLTGLCCCRLLSSANFPTVNDDDIVVESLIQNNWFLNSLHIDCQYWLLFLSFRNRLLRFSIFYIRGDWLYIQCLHSPRLFSHFVVLQL